MSWHNRVPREYSKPHMTVLEILRELQKEGLDFTYRSEQLVPTKFREWPFKVDILITQPFDGVIEVQGRRWHDRTKTQRRKVEVKRECLEGEGYEVLFLWDDELRRKSDRGKVKEKIRQFLKG